MPTVCLQPETNLRAAAMFPPCLWPVMDHGTAPTPRELLQPGTDHRAPFTPTACLQLGMNLSRTTPKGCLNLGMNSGYSHTYSLPRVRDGFESPPKLTECLQADLDLRKCPTSIVCLQLGTDHRTALSPTQHLRTSYLCT